MNAPDKRNVATDALATLGTIIDENAGRDAIHIAVEPVEAGEFLHPGQHVGAVNGVASSTVTHVGIVDPYLTAKVEPGQRFWLFVYPRQITSLRHVWSHPAFDDEAIAATPNYPKEAARKRLDEFAQGVHGSFTADAFLKAVEEGSWTCESTDDDFGYEDGLLFNENGFTTIGFEGAGSVPDYIWTDIETLLGRPVERDKDYASYFACSC